MFCFRFEASGKTAQPGNAWDLEAMKRARAARNVFGDSDSDDSLRRVRIHPRMSLAAEGERSLEKADEEDTLDAFINDLEQKKSCDVPLQDHRPSTPEEERKEFRDVHYAKHLDLDSDLNEPDDNDTSRSHARDLVLPPVDHASQQYSSISKNLYVPLPRLETLSERERRDRLNTAGVAVSGATQDAVPVDTFQDLALTLPKPLLGSVLHSFKTPTTVQRVAIPAALAGYDLVAVAKTGSGKTVAYALPLLTHVNAQKKYSSVRGKGPAAIVIAPTRELATQIAGVMKNHASSLNIGVASVVGGIAKYEQFKMLRDGGARIVVCTPGRFIDMLKMKACGLSKCSFVVLDEADRMFDLGFGRQVDALLSQIRPDAQKLLFSATFPKKVESLARTYLRNPLRIVVSAISTPTLAELGINRGSQGEGMPHNSAPRRPGSSTASVPNSTPMVSDNVVDNFVILETERNRPEWLYSNLARMLDEGLVIVFCQTRGGCAALANKVRAKGTPAACVHGETDPSDRDGLLRMFKRSEIPLLITTDLAARGLDIPEVRNVVNYESAKSWEWHVHRVGRTGRAERKGCAYTLLVASNKSDLSFAERALMAFRRAKRLPPAALTDYARRIGKC